MEKRESWLEKYRKAEREIISAQQVHYYKKQLARLEQINKVRSQKRAIEVKQAQMQQKANKAAMAGFSQALLAGALPALKASQGGSWKTQHSMMALEDTANALQAMPEIEQPPDLSHHIEKLNVSFQGLEGIGVGNLKSNAKLRDVRAKFLKWYTRRTTPLVELR